MNAWPFTGRRAPHQPRAAGVAGKASALAMGVAVSLVALLAACQPSTPSATQAGASGASAGQPSDSAASPSFQSVDITGANYAKAFSLPDVDGKTRTLAEFKGQVVFLFFGYTQCPDVCPTTMADLAEVRRRLGPDGQRLQGVFITVDPQRDTAAVLKPYLAALDPSFVGLRGSEAQTQAVAKDFKVFYQQVPARDGHYTIDHTAGAFVFDPQGHVRLFVRYGLGVDALTSDIKQLLAAERGVAAKS